MEHIHSKTAEIWLANGIVWIRLKGVFTELEDIKERIQIIKKISCGQRALLLIDGREVSSSSKEAREYLAGKDAFDTTIAIAFLTDLLANKMVVNFYNQFNRPITPTKIFSTEEKAIEWLKGFTKPKKVLRKRVLEKTA